MSTNTIQKPAGHERKSNQLWLKPVLTAALCLTFAFGLAACNEADNNGSTNTNNNAVSDPAAESPTVPEEGVTTTP